MKKYFLLVTCCVFISKVNKAQSGNILWYKQPAIFFEETLVLGNGKVGASIFGGVQKDEIYLNDATLWSGEPVQPNPNPDTYKMVEKVRNALNEEDYELADKLQRGLQGPYTQSYMPLGTMYIYFDNSDNFNNYYRELDISKALAKVSYECNGVKYKREYFISYPDSIMTIRLTSDKKKSINCSIGFHSLLRFEPKTNDDILEINGYAPYNVEPSYRNNITDPIQFDKEKGTRFMSLFKIKHKDGNISHTDSTLVLSDCSEATIYVSIATSFNSFDKNPATEGKNYHSIAYDQLEKAFNKPYNNLLQCHLQDYQELFNRVRLSLGNRDSLNIPTDKRLLNYSDGAEDKSLEELYFNFSRYLLISSSRTKGVPANLQGIWNPYIRPPWSSNYTVNINVEENYWLAETANLSELHTPLLQFISNVATTGENAAKTYYGTKGWVVCQNSDIWALSNPVGENEGGPNWANWNMGGVWLCSHLWEHYAFTQNKTFLKEQAYPLMKGAVQFCLDWMVKDKNGKWITSPSTSPENIFITPDGYHGSTLYGATADLAMIRELFIIFLKTANELNMDNDLTEKIKEVQKELYPYQIGAKGNLQEWYYDWEDQDPKHRHQSHLFGLHPGHHITPYGTPELAEACRTTLELKGDNTTGWSKGWRINLWARLWDGNRAYKMYRELLRYVDPDGMNGKRRGGGTYPNLFDAHPPFQIDGNFGGAAAVIEMLMQSTDNKIYLLPALPDTWSEGFIHGICARGGFEVNMNWENKKLITTSIKAKVDRETTLVYGNKQKHIKLKKGETIVVKWQ
jgi:alpha-L-fucosidase 2